MVDELWTNGTPDRLLTGEVGAYGHMPYVKFVRIAPIHLPLALPEDAGQDLVTDSAFWLWPFQTRRIHSGVCVELPCGTYGQIIGKSSLAAKSVGPLGGVIDPSYRGEVIVVLHNYGLLPRRFRKGAKIAQLVTLYVKDPLWTEVEELSASWRGSRGFGAGTGT